MPTATNHRTPTVNSVVRMRHPGAFGWAQIVESFADRLGCVDLDPFDVGQLYGAALDLAGVCEAWIDERDERDAVTS